MAPSVDMFKSYNLGSGFLGRHSMLRILVSFASLWLEEPTSELLLAFRPMVTIGSKAYASSYAEGNNGRFRRHTSEGNLERLEAEGTYGGGQEMSPGECWFTMETSPTEHQALFQL